MRCSRCVNAIPSQKSIFGIKTCARISGGLPREVRLILSVVEIAVSGLGRGAEV